MSTKIPGIHSKADHPPHMLKTLTLETLEHKYPKCSWIHIFTGGSAEKAVKNGGSGMIAIHPSRAAFSKVRPVGVQSTNFKQKWAHCFWQLNTLRQMPSNVTVQLYFLILCQPFTLCSQIPQITQQQPCASNLKSCQKKKKGK